MIGGMQPPTWDDCCGMPRNDAAPLFAGGPERLICSKCYTWCNKPISLDPRKLPVTTPEWYERMWAT